MLSNDLILEQEGGDLTFELQDTDQKPKTPIVEVSNVEMENSFVKTDNSYLADGGSRIEYEKDYEAMTADYESREEKNQ